MASMVSAAQASRSNSPGQMVIDLEDIGNIGKASRVSVWESSVAGGREAGNKAWEALARACRRCVGGRVFGV
jgi:hypothetical protein